MKAKNDEATVLLSVWTAVLERPSSPSERRPPAIDVTDWTCRLAASSAYIPKPGAQWLQVERQATRGAYELTTTEQ